MNAVRLGFPIEVCCVIYCSPSKLLVSTFRAAIVWNRDALTVELRIFSPVKSVMLEAQLLRTGHTFFKHFTVT